MAAIVTSKFFTESLGRDGLFDWLPDQLHIGQLVTISGSDEEFRGDPNVAQYNGRTGTITNITSAETPYRKGTVASKATEGDQELLTQRLVVALDATDAEPAIEIKDVSLYGVLLGWNQQVLAAVTIAKKGAAVGTWKTRYVEVYADCIRYWRNDKFDRPCLGVRPITQHFKLLSSRSKGFNVGKISLLGAKFSLGGQPYQFGMGMQFGPTVRDAIWFSHKEEFVVVNLSKALMASHEALKAAGKLKRSSKLIGLKDGEMANQAAENEDAGALDDDDAQEQARLAAEAKALEEANKAATIQAAVRGKLGRKMANGAATAAMSSPRVQGVLEKKGDKLGMWSTSYYVLAPTKCLFAFSSEASYASYEAEHGLPGPSHVLETKTQSGIKRVHFLKNCACEIIDSTKRTFAIVPRGTGSNDRERMFRAASDEEFTLWVKQIRRLLPMSSEDMAQLRAQLDAKVSVSAP